jgi:hypothetical protein
VQPLDLARQQATEAERRHTVAALRHWERLLRAVPARRFPPDSGDAREPRFWELECRSSALFLAVQSVVHRTGVDSGVVLLAAYATAMARTTGASPVVAQIVVDNRFRPGFAGSVSHLAQYCPVAIDVLHRTFDEITSRAWQASVTAAKYGYYDAAACHELVARVGAERGEAVETACFVNDRRTGGRPKTDVTPSPQDVEDALGATVWRWGRRFDWYDGLFFMHLDDADAPDPGLDGTARPGDAIAFTVWADTRRLAPAGIEAFARHFEAVVVEAAFNPGAIALADGTRSG